MVRGIVGRDGAWRVSCRCAIAAGFPACRAMAAGFLRRLASRLRAGRHDPGWLPGAMAAGFVRRFPVGYQGIVGSRLRAPPAGAVRAA
ncbi:hypothetical protein ACFWQL_30325 [Amycolatopsis thermoflava]|uniref:hypothetical protein n=1 Tax=Amycolatopsis thermoflava TaxID=84480 RepID=UPI00366803B9